jgi:hypothetical protein
MAYRIDSAGVCGPSYGIAGAEMRLVINYSQPKAQRKYRVFFECGDHHRQVPVTRRLQILALFSIVFCVPEYQPCPHRPRRVRTHRATDRINQSYGTITLASARLLSRSSMPDVISPAWKPDGHRRAV